MWKVWIVSFFIWTCCVQVSIEQKTIPRQLIAFLNNATTFGELEQRMKVSPSSTSRMSGGQSRSSSPNFGSDVTVIDDPKQSQDSCKIVNVCVALPVVERTGIFLFPKCIELPQCLGGCCTNGDNCHAVDSENVRVRYKTWRFLDDGQSTFDFLGENLVDMKKHKTCGCTQCTEKPVCNDRQEVINCQCQCKNLDEKGTCQGANHRWSDDKCECTCIRTCPSSTFLNKRTCSCEPIRSYDSSAITDGSNESDDFGRIRDTVQREENVYFDSRRRPSYETTSNQRRYGGRPRH